MGFHGFVSNSVVCESNNRPESRLTPLHAREVVKEKAAFLLPGLI